MQDINQLKLILETVGQTTESAKWVLLAWIGIDLAKLIVCWVGSVWIGLKITKAATSLISAQIFGMQCRDMVISGQVGTGISQSEKKAVVAAINRGIQIKE